MNALLQELATPRGILQVLFLSAAILLILSFLRGTRATGMVRGLAVALLVLGPGVWLIAFLLDLEEVRRIFDAIAQVAVIVLAILFHPELRRGITRLGEHEVLGRFLRSDQTAVIEELSQAALSMARARVGALVAIERRTPLDSYVEGAVPIGAALTRHLLEAIFHPGNRLHDGAVIVRKGRIEAAACILPLTDRRDLDKSVGTRHRAAIGLSEETDAVVLVVSEETGAISLCIEGRIERRVAKDAIEGLLGRALDGLEEPTEEQSRGSLPTRFLNWLRSRPSEKLTALAVGVALFAGAWSSGRAERILSLEVRLVPAAESRRAAPGEVLVQVPDEHAAYFLVEGAGRPQEMSRRVSVRGPREFVRPGSLSPAGTVVLDPGADGTAVLSLKQVEWSWGGEQAEGIELAWEDGAPRFVLNENRVEDLALQASRVPQLKGLPLPAGWQVQEQGASFMSPSARLRWPAELDGADLAEFTLAPSEDLSSLSALTDADLRARPWVLVPLELRPEDLELGLELMEPEVLMVRVEPTPQELIVRAQVATVALGGGSLQDASGWADSTEEVRITVRVGGLRATSESQETGARLALRRALEAQVRAYVDVSGKELKSTSFPVQVLLPDAAEIAAEIPDSASMLVEGGLRLETRKLEPRSIVLEPAPTEGD